MTWVNAAIALGSAAVSYYGSQQATDASKKAGKKNNQLAQQQYQNSLQMLEPNRMMGYQAGADLSSLYGWATPGYTPYAALGGGGTVKGVGATNDVVGNLIRPFDPVSTQFLYGSKASARNVLDPLGFTGGGAPKLYGGTINPTTGTVDVANGHSYQDEALTHYLRTGEWNLTGKKSNDLKAQIDQLRASGWTYDPETGKGSYPGQIEATPAGEPGNMSRFFTSPDYQYTMSEGIKANDQSAAARGGALSGNAIRANTQYAGNLASGQYQNYVNNLFRAMGYGTQATTGAVAAGENYTNQQTSNNTQMGDIRASGIANQYGAASGLLNSLGGIYGNYLGNRNGTAGASSYGGTANAFSPSYGFTDMQLQPWSTF